MTDLDVAEVKPLFGSPDDGKTASEWEFIASILFMSYNLIQVVTVCVYYAVQIQPILTQDYIEDFTDLLIPYQLAWYSYLSTSIIFNVIPMIMGPFVYMLFEKLTRWYLVVMNVSLYGAAISSGIEFIIFIIAGALYPLSQVN